MTNNRTNPQTFSQLSPQQQQAAAMIASGATGRAVATELEISEGTVSRWRAMPEFRAAVNSILKKLQEDHVNRLRALTDSAVECLESLMLSPTAPAAERLKAAQFIVGLSFKSMPQIGPDDPQGIINSDEAERQKQFFSSLSIAVQDEPTDTPATSRRKRR